MFGEGRHFAIVGDSTSRVSACARRRPAAHRRYDRAEAWRSGYAAAAPTGQRPRLIINMRTQTMLLAVQQRAGSENQNGILSRAAAFRRIDRFSGLNICVSSIRRAAASLILKAGLPASLVFQQAQGRSLPTPGGSCVQCFHTVNGLYQTCAAGRR